MTKYKFKLEYALLHLNYNCNLNCEHCRVPFKDKQRASMSLELAKNIINQFSDLKVPIVTFTGGEPTIYANILELVNYTVNKGIKVRLQTNFAKVDSLFLEDYYKSGGRFVSLSIDGLQKTHDKLRGKEGLFSKIILLISKYRHILTFQVDFVLSKLNFIEILPLIELLKDCGVKIFSFRTMVPVANISASNSYEYTKQELYEAYYNIYHKTKSITDMKIISPDPLYNLIKFEEVERYDDNDYIDICGCSMGLGFLSIQPNADVILCTFINEPIGNLQTESLKLVIRRISNLDSVKKQITREGINECSECKYRYFCGGCRARALEILGDINETDPLCFKDYLNIESYQKNLNIN